MKSLIEQDIFSDEAQFFREVLQAEGIGLLAYDHASDTNIWSSELLAILGREQGEGRKSLNEWFELIHPEDQAQVRSCLEAAYQNSNHLHDVEYRFLHRQGYWVWLRDRIRVIRRNPDGSPLLTAGITRDINQARLAKSAMEKAEHRFRDLVEQIPVGVYTLETFGTVEQSRFTFLSDRLCELVGISRSELMQDASMAFVAAIPGDHGRFIKANEDAFLKKEPFHFEGQFLVRDQIRWLSISSHPSLSNDEASRWDGVVTDITNRKQADLAEKSMNAELEVRVAERTAELAAITAKAQFTDERMRHALEASSTGVVDWNMKTGDVFYLFPQAFNHGDPLPSKEAFELWKSLIHPDDLNKVVTYITGHMPSDDKQEMEYRLRFSDGRYHWVLAKGKTVARDAGGNPIRVIGTHTEIDARKLIEQTNDRLALVLEASSDLIATGSTDGLLDYGNETCRRLLGCSDEVSLGGKHIRDAHPEWAYRWLMQKAIPTAMSEGSWQGDTVFLSHDGVEKEFSQLILAPRNPQTGEVEFLATICRDMTERKRLEDAIRDRNEALELSDRRKTEFLATLAHELRNPMSPLLIAANLLQEGHVDKTNLPWIADLVERQVMHLSRLVDDLLDVSRINQGKINLNRQLVDLCVLLPEATQMVLPSIEAAHHQLSVKLPEEPIQVDGDPVRLVQVVTNILNNAAKFTEPGGQLALILEQRDNQAVITVNDNGRGIEPVYLNQVFDLFAQSDGAEHRSNDGLGVGLYLSKQLIQLHGGSIKANSLGPNSGSEFVVQLPLLHVAKTAATEPPTPQAETSNGIRRVLVVDDNLDAATGLELLLQQKGHDVRVVHDGHTALECVQVFNPEIVLLDIGMPDMDGYEVCRQIRATARGKRLVICAVTGWGQPEDKKRAFEAGFDCHLTKPVKVEDILSQVNNYRGSYERHRDFNRSS